MKGEILPGLLASAGAIVAAGPICDACLGGAFGRLGHGWQNAERGRALRTVLALAGIEGDRGTCWVCQDLFAQSDAWARRAADAVADVEFATYLFAVKPTLRWQTAEATLVERFGLAHAEPQKHAWNRAVGKAFEGLVGHGTVDFNDPDLKVTMDVGGNSLSVRLASLFLEGRYRKLARGIPQTHWPCRRCHGRGCVACGGTGKQYAESVEEIVAGPLVEAARAKGALLHGAGREDIDARMLGTGRPFVLELLAPKTRSLDVAGLRGAVNRAGLGKVEVTALVATTRGAVAQVKESRAEKTYRAVVEFTDPVAPEALARALQALVGVIHQHTPQRVLHRRADLERTRRVLAASGEMRGEREAEVVLRTDAGLYVKELASGDDGRTAPSLASLLGIGARVTELDVVDIAASPSADPAQENAMDSRRAVP